MDGAGACPRRRHPASAPGPSPPPLAREDEPLRLRHPRVVPLSRPWRPPYPSTRPAESGTVNRVVMLLPVLRARKVVTPLAPQPRQVKFEQAERQGGQQWGELLRKAGRDLDRIPNVPRRLAGDEGHDGIDEGELGENLPHPIGRCAARGDRDHGLPITTDEVVAVGPLLPVPTCAAPLRTPEQF